MNKKTWFNIAIGYVCFSIISLFLPIITYIPADFYIDTKIKFSIVDLIGGSEVVDYLLTDQYYGPVIFRITGTTVAILAVIVILSVICAVVGLITLRAQRPNTWQFVLTIIGLVGTALPSLILIVCVIGFGQYYPGTIGIGIAPIITPIAMILCIAVVIRRKNRVAEELRKEMEQQGMIYRAGDL